MHSLSVGWFQCDRTAIPTACDHALTGMRELALVEANPQRHIVLLARLRVEQDHPHIRTIQTFQFALWQVTPGHPSIATSDDSSQRTRLQIAQSQRDHQANSCWQAQFPAINAMRLSIVI